MKFTLPYYVYRDELISEPEKILNRFGKMPEIIENALHKDIINGDLDLCVEELDRFNEDKLARFINLVEEKVHAALPELAFSITFDHWIENDSVYNWKYGDKRPVVKTKATAEEFIQAYNKYHNSDIKTFKGVDASDLVETILEKETTINEINDEASKDLREEEYWQIDLDRLNQEFTFKPEIESISDLPKYNYKEDENVLIWNEDAPGQLKLKLESLAELNKVIISILESLD